MDNEFNIPWESRIISDNQLRDEFGITHSENVYLLKHSNEQQLINLMFNVAMVLYDGNKPLKKKFKDREVLAEWIREHLKILGFYTSPIGMSHASLEKIHRK